MDRGVTQPAVILYGPPASGKDTITTELTRVDPRYAPFQRIKVGAGNTDGYRVADHQQLAALRAAGDVLFENQRCGNTYVVDRSHLNAMLASGRMPVVHLGQLEGVRAVARHPDEWIIVLLWCSRDTTAERILRRQTSDVDARLAAWDETLFDLKRATCTDFTGRIDTDQTGPGDAARTINAWVKAPRAGDRLKRNRM
jgi:guanylate kinase